MAAKGVEDQSHYLIGRGVGGGDFMAGDALIEWVTCLEALGCFAQQGSLGSVWGGGLVLATGDQGLQGSCQIDDGGFGGLFQEQTVSQGFRRSATQGYHDMCMPEKDGKRGGLLPAEGCFTTFGEDLRDGLAGAALDLVVQIAELPAEALGEELTYGRLAGAHKAGEHDAFKPGWGWLRCWRWAG